MRCNKLLAPALHIVGKDDFELDKSVPLFYLFQTCISYAASAIRGFIRGFRYASKNGPLFMGRKVKLRCKSKISLGAKVRLQDGVFIDALSSNGVRLGDRSLLGRYSRIECTGSLSHIGKGLSIGNNSTFGSNCYFGAAGGISIGNDVIAGQYVRFHSENHVIEDIDTPIRQQGVTHRGIFVDDDVWIGAGAVFLDGANVGHGCVVAANAVVASGTYPAYSILGGVPARVLKSRIKESD